MENLSKIKKTVAMKEEKTFICPSCGVKSDTKKKFARHLKTHDNSKLKKCLLCGYSGRADKLERHVSLVHKASGTADAPVEDNKFNPKDYYTKKKLKSYHSRKFHTWQSDYEINLKPLPLEDWQVKFLLVFEDILESVKGNMAKDSMGKIIVFLKGFEYPLNERVEKFSDLTNQRLLERIERVLNSNEKADLSEGFKINVVYTEMPKGSMSARTKDKPMSSASRSHTIFAVDDDDDVDVDDDDYDLPKVDSDEDDF